jgi:hypothetical protein
MFPPVVGLAKTLPINTMVRFLKLVAFLDNFRTILGPFWERYRKMALKWSKNATNFKERTMVLIGPSLIAN